MSSSQHESQQPPVAVRRGQACDRCRAKKIKCDAAIPQCSHCAASGATCDVSTRLQRKTLVRGFNSGSTAPDNALESELCSLKSQVQVISEERRALRTDIESLRQFQDSARPRKVQRVDMSNAGPSPIASVSVNTGLSTTGSHEYIFRHMGRLVQDNSGWGRWSGSTTGVHFISSVEDVYLKEKGMPEKFPEDCFRLHLLEPSSNYSAHDPASTRIDVNALRSILNLPMQYYLSQVDTFNASFAAHCPLLLRGRYEQALAHASTNLWLGDVEIDQSDRATFLILLVVLNMSGDPNAHSTPDIAVQSSDQANRHNAIEGLHSTLGVRTDIWTLQACLVYALYLQVGGQSGRLLELTGSLVSSAQSLGMHRHAQRFDLCESEVEFRKRIWWYIYGLDKLIAAQYGLPRLIQDLDVDNDLPVDCDIQSLDTPRPTRPLPGESTPVLLFNFHVQLLKIFSSILGQLYTTTDRRNGMEKIVRLDRGVRVWNASLNEHVRRSLFEAGRPDKTLNHIRTSSKADDDDRSSARLELLANYAMVLIHRPGLTFEHETPGFQECLRHCLRFYTTIITLLSASEAHLAAALEVPFGPSIVFQAGLMHIFYHTTATIATDVSVSQSHGIVSRAVEILQGMQPKYPTDVATTMAFKLSIEVLQKLSAESLSDENDGGVDPVAMSTLEGPSISTSIAPEFAAPLSDLSMWNMQDPISHGDFDAAPWDITTDMLFGPTGL